MSAAHQLTLFDVLEEQDRADWLASNAKTAAELVPGDYVEIRRDDGMTERGWCTRPHPVDGVWQVVREGSDWTAGPHLRYARTRFIHLHSRRQAWRFVRHDADWTLTPTPDQLRDWMREKGADWPIPHLHDLYHAATSMWPIGIDDSWREVIPTTFTEIARARIPVVDWLRDQRKASGAGNTIWSCPPRIQRLITDTVWPLPGAERLDALLQLRWTRAEHFNDAHCGLPEGLLAFNRRAASIYEGYLRHAMAHAESPRQLLELCDAWGHNPVQEDRDEVTP